MRSKWLAMLFISLGISMIMVDASVVNVALPTIIEDIQLTITDAEWANSIYPLVFASFLITFGRLGDRYGRRKLFIIGAIVFMVASVLVAQSTNGPQLIGARVIQGLGGAMMLPTSLALVNATYKGRDRAIAFGLWGATIGGMAAIGPLIGGWLTTSYSWTWAFWINVPIGIVLVIGTLTLVPESREAHPVAGVDLLGIVLSILGLGLLVFGLIEGQTYGWFRAVRDVHVLGVTAPAGTLSPVPVAFALSAVFLAAFYVVERRREAHDKVILFDFELYRIRSFGWGNLVALIVAFGEFGLIFVLPLFTQSVLGYSAFTTGALVATLAVGVFLSGATAGPLVNRFGGRRIVRVGMVLEMIGMLMVAYVISSNVSGVTMIPGLMVYGIGLGFAAAQLTNVVLSGIPPDKGGQASGAQSTVRQVGSALGIAVIGAVLVTSLSSMLTTRLNTIPDLPPAAATSISDAVSRSAGIALIRLDEQLAAQGTPAPLAAEIVDESKEAMTDAARRTIFVAALFMLLGLLFTLGLPDDKTLLEATEAAEAAEREADQAESDRADEAAVGN